MSFTSVYEDFTWWMFTLPAILQTQNFLNLLISSFVVFIGIRIVTWAFTAGGSAWKNGLNCIGRISIPGPKGLPIFGSLFSLSHGLAHRTLANLVTSTYGATQVMAISLGSTRAIVSSDPTIAREILTSPHFANRPVKESAKQLMFSRAIGFAPNGTYWRLLRKIASSHLFAPKLIMAHEWTRQLECNSMLNSIANEQNMHGSVTIRKHLQTASLNNIMGIVFGKRYELIEESNEAKELQEIVAEGFDLLGAFNWSDHLPWLKYFYDPFFIQQRCSALVPRVQNFVKSMIEQHKNGKSRNISEASDFVHVLLALSGEEKLHEEDMIAVLWEMIFRGTDTTALLTEWVMAELVVNQDIQAKLYKELQTIVGNENVTDAQIAKLPYLQAVIKETLRLHPPGPLLSWARLSASDVQLSNGMIIPANTTAMINMWAITHDPNVWDNATVFKPERFLTCHGGENIDVRGNDLRLAPFGAGRRICPGKNLGLVTVSLWVAKLVHNFMWFENESHPVELSEVLKLSCEMKHLLSAKALPRNGGH